MIVPHFGMYSPYRFRSPFYRNYNYTFNRKNSYNNKENFDNNEKKVNETRSNSITKNINSDSIPYEESEVRYMNGPPKPIFEIFGIRLFFDDILLISLIFFLYNEGVQDQGLFIALILLLLS